MAQYHALQKAIAIFGSQTALAAAIGITSQAVSQAVRRGRVHPLTAVAIERATNGKVTRQELLPSIFGPEQD